MPAAQKALKKPIAAARPVKKGDHVFLVDGSGYIFRAYHALPPISRKSDGLQLNAVFGFCNMLWKLLRDMQPEERPTHLAVIFDKSEKTFRTEMYADYKAHRPDPPDDLKPQFKYIREAVQAFDLPCLEQDGFEADDLIATYVRQACEAGATATIVSSDKDLMQLVSDCVIMFDTMKDKKIGRAEVMEKFGVPPEKVIEVQSLIGDSTDNVPGVPGIGVKTAAQLIGEYGDLETLLARTSEIKQEKRRQSLIEHADNARLSKKLVTLDDQVKLAVPLSDLAVHEPDYKRLVAFLKAMEFNGLMRRVAEFASVDAGAIDAEGRLAGHHATQASAAVSASPAAGEGGTARTVARCRHGRRRRGSGKSRPDARGALRDFACCRAERSLLRPALASPGGRGRRSRLVPRRYRARPDSRMGRARNACAAAYGFRRAQGRPRSEIRLADICAARHRDCRLRRHHADVVCARCRPE